MTATPTSYPFPYSFYSPQTLTSHSPLTSEHISTEILLIFVLIAREHKEIKPSTSSPLTYNPTPKCQHTTKSPSHTHTQASLCTAVVVARETHSRLPRLPTHRQRRAQLRSLKQVSQSPTPSSPLAVEEQETSTDLLNELSSLSMKSSNARPAERRE